MSYTYARDLRSDIKFAIDAAMGIKVQNAAFAILKSDIEDFKDLESNSPDAKTGTVLTYTQFVKVSNKRISDWIKGGSKEKVGFKSVINDDIIDRGTIDIKKDDLPKNDSFVIVIMGVLKAFYLTTEQIKEFGKQVIVPAFGNKEAYQIDWTIGKEYSVPRFETLWKEYLLYGKAIIEANIFLIDKLLESLPKYVSKFVKSINSIGLSMILLGIEKHILDRIAVVWKYRERFGVKVERGYRPKRKRRLAEQLDKVNDLLDRNNLSWINKVYLGEHPYY